MKSIDFAIALTTVAVMLATGAGVSAVLVLPIYYVAHHSGYIDGLARAKQLLAEGARAKLKEMLDDLKRTLEGAPEKAPDDGQEK